MTPEERQRRLREIAAHVAHLLEQEAPEGSLTINDIEELAEQAGHEVQREVSGRLLRRQIGKREGNQQACACGGVALYRGDYPLSIATVAGRVRLCRPYYYCSACRQGHCPADEGLRLGAANTTPAAQARLAALSALVPYVQVGDLVAQLGLPLQVDLKSTQQVTQAIGSRLPVEPERLYDQANRPVALALDGVTLPTWEGSREVRCAVIYEPDAEAPRTPEGEAGLRKEYLATTKSRESLVRAACARAGARCGTGGVLAVVGDAAALDWVDLRPYLEGKVGAWVEILDFFHVAQRLGVIARAMYPEDRGVAEAWKKARRKELLEEGPAKLLKGLWEWEPEGAAAQEVKREQSGYFQRHQERMQYPQYQRRGLPIGSGAVEGACKHVVADRFKGSGMRWKLPTAEPVLRLRAALLTQPRLDLRAFAGPPVAIATS